MRGEVSTRLDRGVVKQRRVGNQQLIRVGRRKHFQVIGDDKNVLTISRIKLIQCSAVGAIAGIAGGARIGQFDTTARIKQTRSDRGRGECGSRSVGHVQVQTTGRNLKAGWQRVSHLNIERSLA